jgi:hypothetical protein
MIYNVNSGENNRKAREVSVFITDCEFHTRARNVAAQSYVVTEDLIEMCTTYKRMVRSDMSKPDLIFFFNTRVHKTKSTDKILAANTHCKYFLKIAEHCQYCNLPYSWRNVHP